MQIWTAVQASIRSNSQYVGTDFDQVGRKGDTTGISESVFGTDDRRGVYLDIVYKTVYFELLINRSGAEPVPFGFLPARSAAYGILLTIPALDGAAAGVRNFLRMRDRQFRTACCIGGIE